WDVSCPVTTFCVAGDETGSILWGISGPPPVVTSVVPNSGSAAGGTLVTITGNGFSGTTGVTFGSVAATNFTVLSNTKINVVAPAQPAGLHNIFVTGPTGASAAAFGDLFTYISPPSVTSVVPNS